jgi:hypothetical protein
MVTTPTLIINAIVAVIESLGIIPATARLSLILKLTREEQHDYYPPNFNMQIIR